LFVAGGESGGREGDVQLAVAGVEVPGLLSREIVGGEVVGGNRDVLAAVGDVDDESAVKVVEGPCESLEVGL
jgi:hypothetical protein